MDDSKMILIDRDSSLMEPSNPGDIGYDLIAMDKPTIVGRLAYEGTPEANRFKSELGFDIYSRIDYIEYRTNVRMFDPTKQIAGLIFPRSSLSKYNLALANSVGVCDPLYLGNYILRFKYVTQPEDMFFLDTKVANGRLTDGRLGCRVNEDKIFKQGDKIGQVVFYAAIRPLFQNVDIDSHKTQRNDGGFGSTDARN